MAEKNKIGLISVKKCFQKKKINATRYLGPKVNPKYIILKIKYVLQLNYVKNLN
jgi:hypothetical protein